MMPTFFIAGAPKAGTDLLYYQLDQHPEIYMSPLKEPNFFAEEIRPENFGPSRYISRACGFMSEITCELNVRLAKPCARFCISQDGMRSMSWLSIASMEKISLPYKHSSFRNGSSQIICGEGKAFRHVEVEILDP